MRRSKGTVVLAAALAVCTLFSGCKKVEQGEQSSASIASHAADAQQEDPTDPIDDWTRQETGQKSVVVGKVSGEAGTTPADSTTTASSKEVDALLKQMTLQEKIYQMFLVTPEAITGVDTVVQAGDATKAALQEQPVGGLIYFAANLETQSQTKEMLTTTQDYAKASSNGIGLWLAVDEEGGTVARVADQLGTTAFSDMSVYGAENDSTQAYSIGQTIGTDIHGLGFNLDFAPVADVDICSENELGGRIFSDDPNVVANMVSNVVKGLQNSGVSATLKHFPGLGAENGNSHYDGAVRIDRSLEELRSTEFIPFSAGIEAGVDFVMVGHQIMTEVDADTPSDLSHAVVTDLLKQELGFKGLAITDAQNMNTISANYSSGEAAVLAIQAGIDIVLMPVNLTEAVEGVYQAVQDGTISEERIDESVQKILLQKQRAGLL